MKNRIKNLSRAGGVSAMLFASQMMFAGTPTWFTPLTESAIVVSPNEYEELAEPWVAPEGIIQSNLMSLNEVENQILSPGQSVVRVSDASLAAVGRGPTSASMFDMIAYDFWGDFIFIPHETPVGAGVTRVDLLTRRSDVLFRGDDGGINGDWSNDYGAFDPCRMTPNDTLLLGEEWSGEGRIIEVLNPYDAPEDIEIRELHSIANVSHEGINFSKKWKNRFIYFVDENNSGSLYLFIAKQAGDYTVGQTFVLSVDDFAGDAGRNWNDSANAGEPRIGVATWVPMTDRSGVPLPGISDPFAPGTGSGRRGADDADGTPYGRPEDVEVGMLANGNEVIYFAATSERTIYSVENPGTGKAIVRVFASDSGTPKNEGFAPTTGEMNSPDNLAQDSLGNIYIIEDAPNGSSTGGDIWFARDTDNDGVAESVDHFMSVRADGCEATGMIFNPVKPTEFVVAVQHPDSTNLSQVPNGLGDAVWQFDLSFIENQEFVAALKKGKKHKMVLPANGYREEDRNR